MKKPDLEKCAQEVDEMQSLPPTFVEVSRLGVFAILTLIHAAIQQRPEMADDGWAKIGIAAARQLQKDLYNQDSEAHKVLEFGWNPELYITPLDVAAMLEDMATRQSEKNKITEQDGGCAETAAQQISRKILESQGYLDM
jgi:hypothetical protein